MTDARVRLAVDAGNTRIKWGLAQAGGWLAHGAVPTNAPEALAEAWRALPRVPDRVAACAVAGQASRSAIEALVRDFAPGAPLRWLASRLQQGGVINGYENPGQLGPDRWAALLGAWHRVGTACTVVNAGTAVTVDALDDTGRFRGGLILPGVRTMLDALERRTAGLQRQHGAYSAFPANTGDAMWTGALDAVVGAVQRAARRLSEIAGRPVDTVLSGGDAGLVASHLYDGVVHVAEHLVLEGLLVADEEGLP